MDFNIANINQDEIFPQRCGEIFITIERNMLFYCTLCEMKYNGFGEYVTHLDDHYPPPNSDPIEEVQIKSEFHDNLNISEECNVLEDMEISISQSEKLLEPLQRDNKNDKVISMNTELIKNKVEIEQKDNESKTNQCSQSIEGIKKFKCLVCTATCKNFSSLKKHEARHKTQKTHQCPQCPKTFYTSNDVKKHLRLHSNDRRFLCTICGKICLSNFKLKDHMRRHTNQRDYKCGQCDKSFYNGRLLAQHVLIHSSERNHKCNICSANFTYRKGLQNHMKLHENKRDYKCQLCSESFNQQAGLFSHIKTRHKSV